MGVYETFSKREARKQKQGQEDVYQYTELPAPFRAQVIHILIDTLGKWQSGRFDEQSNAPNNAIWSRIFKTITRELGSFRLSDRSENNPVAQCVDFIGNGQTGPVLDLIEIAFRHCILAADISEYDRQICQLVQNPRDAFKELNQRFREHGIGYEFAQGELIRLDSNYIHAHAVKPALQLLSGAGDGFAGPLQEFMDAHGKYRHKDFKGTIADALKSFESTLKAICAAQQWPYDAQRDTASKLIEIVFAQNLIPAYLQGQFTGLRAVMESGVPTARNRTSGHGQGPTPQEVPEHFARYVLNLAASNIVFLIESHKALK